MHAEVVKLYIEEQGNDYSNFRKEISSRGWEDNEAAHTNVFSTVNVLIYTACLAIGSVNVVILNCTNALHKTPVFIKL